MERIYEGTVYGTPENEQWIAKMCAGAEIPVNTYIEARVDAYNARGDLSFIFGNNYGIMDKDEIEFPQRQTNAHVRKYRGIVKGFYVVGRVEQGDCVEYRLSRKAVIERYFNEEITKYSHGDIIEGRVSHIGSNKLVFVDLGYGYVTVVTPMNASILRYDRLSDLFVAGEDVKLLVLSGVQETGSQFIHVSHKELLGTWEQNAQKFKVGEKVWGKVYDIADYGTFVQLTANILALTRDVDTSVVKGQPVLVDIQDIDVKRNKLKVQILGRGNVNSDTVQIPRYYFTEGFDFANEEEWVYSLKRKSNLKRTV